MRDKASVKSATHPRRRSNDLPAAVKGRGARTALGILAALLALSCTEATPEIPPRQISESPFHYPEELWDAGVEGETLLEIHVSRVGTVDSARVERSSGHAEFDSAAIDGAALLRFAPARRGEDSVAVRVHLPVQFQIPADSQAASPTTAPAAGSPPAGDSLAPR